MTQTKLKPKDRIESEEFYNLMQSYRFCHPVQTEEVLKSYLAVKTHINAREDRLLRLLKEAYIQFQQSVIEMDWIGESDWRKEVEQILKEEQ